MTINQINDLLQKLSKEPNRENNVAIANALLHLMHADGILDKPKLLQTQYAKTQDYLATNPLTKQSLFYLLTETNQTIIARDSVVNKVRKGIMEKIGVKEARLSRLQNPVAGWR